MGECSTNTNNGKRIASLSFFPPDKRTQNQEAAMTEQLIQIIERVDPFSEWKIRTVIQLWPNIPEERERLRRFMEEFP